MKRITLEQFIEIIEDLGIEDIPEKIEQMAKQQDDWSVLDILSLDSISVDDKLWAVLRPELIDEPILHEFACRCAEEALKLVDEPDQRSIDAIAAKRAWVRGEITDEELTAAREAAADVAWYAALTAARSAADDAAQSAADVAWYAAWEAARNEQVEMLVGLIEESVAGVEK